MDNIIDNFTNNLADLRQKLQSAEAQITEQTKQIIKNRDDIKRLDLAISQYATLNEKINQIARTLHKKIDAKKNWWKLF